MKQKQQKVLDITIRSRGRRFAREGFFERAKRRPMKGFFYPDLVPYVLCQPCSTLPVGMDYFFACGGSAAFARDLRGTALRLPNFSGGLGDACHQRHLPRETLDDLLQAASTRQRESAAPCASPVPPSAACFTRRDHHAGDRRHPGAANVEKRTRMRHSPRSQQEIQPAAIPVIPVLGHVGRQRAGKQWHQLGVADPVPPGAECGQPQQVEHCPRSGARRSTPSDAPHPTAIRFVVHAQKTGDAFDAQRNTGDWAGASRHGLVPASHAARGQAGGALRKEARSPSEIWNQTHAAGGRGIASRAAKTDTLWQGTVGSPAFGRSPSALPKGNQSARSLVRILRCGQTPLVEGALATGDRIGVERGRDRAYLRPALEHRAIIPQPETLVGCQQPVATIQTRAGIVDADPIHGMDTDTTAQPDGATGILPTRPSCTLAYQSTVHCRLGGAMDADRVYRTCLQGRFRPEVAEILVPKRAKRPKNARVTPPAPVADTLLNNIGHPDRSVYEMRGGSANV